MTTKSQLDILAEQVLNDRLLLRKLSDRIYQLLQEEIRNQRDRDRERRF